MNIILAPFAWLLTVFYNLFNSYGLAIILFALVVKVVLFPFALKGKRSMVKMTALQSKQARLQKQYANNKEKYNEELQSLYEREKVNPMSGCLWSFVPLLVLIPLYAIIRQPMNYMMGMTNEQVVEIGNNILHWAQVAVGNNWAREAAALTTQTASAGYNQLYMASIFNGENIAAIQAIAPKAFVINFDFLGMNLAQQPQWKIWEQTLNWNNIGLFLMPIISAAISLLFSIVMTKTNNINNPSGQKQGNFMTYVFSPLMALWIGYFMPAGLCVYWIANSALSMVQEVIAAQLLKKDYAAAAEAQRKQELLDKEEEKRKKELLRQERAKRAEEKKKSGKKKKEPKETAPGVDATASRVGIRAYARGRNYDPDRFGGVTPYKDPNMVDEDAVEAAREAKAEKAEEAKLEAEITAKVAAEVAALDGDTAEEVAKRLEEVHAGEAEAEAGALAATLEEAEASLDEAWGEVTAEAPAEDENSGDEAPKEE